MSLDLWLEIPCCPTCGHKRETDSFNYTWNVSPMWSLVFPDDTDMVQIDGMSGNDSLMKLEKFRDALKSDPKKFEALNPENGWGSYKGFLLYIEKLILSAREFPEGIWRASR